MYESQRKFKEFAATRDVGLIEQRAFRYSCPILQLDGTKTRKENIDEILAYINLRNHYDALIDENNDPVRDPIPLRRYMDQWDGEAYIDLLQLSPDKAVLEIGVGSGRLAMRICDKCRSFTGIDISLKTIDRAKENLYKFNNVSLIYGNFLTYRFNESFDIIYSSLTFMHFADKRSVICKAASLLSPSGRFILSIDKNRQTEMDYGSRKIIVYPDTKEEIAAFITEAGLNIEKQFETEFAVIFAATR
jgi:SAM-dependent methyltransferase